VKIEVKAEEIGKSYFTSQLYTINTKTGDIVYKADLYTGNKKQIDVRI